MRSIKETGKEVLIPPVTLPGPIHTSHQQGPHAGMNVNPCLFLLVLPKGVRGIGEMQKVLVE